MRPPKTALLGLWWLLLVLYRGELSTDRLRPWPSGLLYTITLGGFLIELVDAFFVCAPCLSSGPAGEFVDPPAADAAVVSAAVPDGLVPADADPAAPRPMLPLVPRDTCVSTGSSRPLRMAFSLREIFHVAISSSSMGDMPLAKNGRLWRYRVQIKTPPTISSSPTTDSTELSTITSVRSLPRLDASPLAVAVAVEDEFVVVVRSVVEEVVIAVERMAEKVEEVWLFACEAEEKEEEEVDERDQVKGREEDFELVVTVDVDVEDPVAATGGVGRAL
jgi:hypothetical protein